MPPRKKLKISVTKSEAVNVTELKSDSGCDWRSLHSRSLHSKYNYILKNNVLSDVKLVVGEEGTVFHCHRLVLAFGSPVFEPMFFGDLAETGETVTIPDVDPEGFQHLIRFLYTGEFSVPNAVVAFKTYFAADKYCVTVLKEFCEKYLCHCNITPSNVWLFFEYSLFLNSQAIRDSCLHVLRQHVKIALEHKSFLDINLHTMESFLKSDDLNASEEIILKSVIRWAEHKSAVDGADSFENILKPLLSNICFGALTANELVHLRCTTRLKEVLNNDDSLAILEHLLNPALCQLPNWCCSKIKRSKIKCSPPSEPSQIQSSSNSRKKNCINRRYFRSPSFPSYSSSSSSLTTTSSDSSTTTTTTTTSSSDDSD